MKQITPTRGSSDPGQLWETVRREKAARGYPWTHLDHNQEEEVWLNPLSLPQDIGRETIKRRDGTIPPEWFHLPDGASPPSVQEMLQSDSPEPDYADSDTSALPHGHSSPPLCGRHRMSRSKSKERRLHKTSAPELSGTLCRPHTEPYSTGHIMSTVQPSSTVHTNVTVQPNVTVQSGTVQHTWQPNKSQPGPQKQPYPGYEPVGSSTNSNNPGYEPVGSSINNKHLVSGSTGNNHPISGSSTNSNHPGYEPVGGGSTSGSNKGLIPISRSPSSRLPTLPTQESMEDNDSDVSPGCFSMIRRSRSRSKSKEVLNKKGKPPRSVSETSAHSDHPYESPKLLTKSDHSLKPSSPRVRKKKRSDIEDGYEPVGTLEDWINNKEKEYEDLENKEELKLKVENMDRSNLSIKSLGSQKTVGSEKSKDSSEHVVTIKETETGRVIFKEKLVMKTEKDKQEKEAKIKQEKELKEKKLKEEKEQKERKQREQKELKEQKAKKKKEEKEIKEKKTLEEKEIKEKRLKEEKEQKELKAKIEKEMKEQKVIREKEQKEQRLKEEKEKKVLKERQVIEEIKKREDQEYEKQLKLQKEKEERDKKYHHEKEETKKKLIEERERREKEAERNFLYPKNNESKIHDNLEQSAFIETNTLENKKTVIEEKEMSNKETRNIQKINEEEIDIIVSNEEPLIVSPNIEDTKPSITEDTTFDGKIEEVKAENIISSQLNNIEVQITKKENEIVIAIEEEKDKRPQQESVIMKKELEKQEKRRLKALAKKEKEEKEKDLKQKELEKLKEQEKRKQDELEKLRQEEEIKKQKELVKQEEKERKALAKKEKEMQEKELKELKKLVNKEKKSKLLSKSFFKFGTKSKSMSDIGNEGSQKKTQPDRDFEDVEFNSEGKSSCKKPEEVYEAVIPSPAPSHSQPCEGAGQHKAANNITQSSQQPRQPSPPGQQKQTNMAYKPKAAKGEVSVVTNEDFATFQQNRGTNGFHDEDEEMNFTPQNGYIDPEEEEMDTQGRTSRSRAKPGFMDRISSFRIPSPGEFKESYLNSNFHKSFHQNLIVKSVEEDQEVMKARRALTQTKSVHELSEIHGFSDFPIPSFKKKSEKKGEDEEESAPLKMPTNINEAGQMAFNTLPRSWREQNIITAQKENLDPEVLEERQNLTKTKTPAELAQFNSLSDIPVPSVIKNLFEKKEVEEAKEPKKRRHSDSEPQAPPSPWDIYHTLPRSLRETKLITNVKENEVDDAELGERRALVESKTPAELSAITKISDFPVPTPITNLFRAKTPAGSKQGSVDDVNQAKRRRSRSASLPKGMNRSFYNSLPRQLTTQNIVTSVKTEEDMEVLEKHRELTQTKTVAELSAITSIADLPIPEKLENFFKGGDKKEKDADDPEAEAKPKLNFSKMNLNDMYNTLPKSLTMELSVGSPVELDRETAEARKKLTEEKTPMELSQIGSIADFPLPSALENIFVHKPTPPERKRDREEKRKRNLTTGAFLSPDFIPMEWTQQQLLVKQTEEEPSEMLLSRKDLVESKKPMELSQIHGMSDFPIPERVETLLRPKKRVLKSTEEKEMSKKVSRSWSSLPTDAASMYATLPKSFKQELMVGSRVEDPDIVEQRREIVKNKSVSELSQIHSFADFPIPASIEKFFKQQPMPTTANGGPPVATPVISRPTSPQSVVDSFYESLPRSLTEQQLLVKSKVEEQDEKLQERREIASTKTPAELSQITSFSDIPIPTPIENLLKKKSNESNEPGTEGSPVPPPRKKWEDMTKEDFYESIPSSLREELEVKRVEEDLDPEELSHRQELVKTKTPAQLSQITSLGEFPIPDCVENLVHKMQAGAEEPKEPKAEEEVSEGPALSRMESLYASIPSSLKTGLIVKTRTEDPELQQARAEVVKSKSVHELSQINSLAEIPIPTTLENLSKKAHGAIERKKKFKEMEDEEPTDEAPKSMSESMYATLPRSLKSELAVKSVVDDQEVTAQRREVVASKSVSELAAINSLSDIPIPANIEKLISKAANMASNEPKEDSAQENLAENVDSPQVPSRNAKKFGGDIYASLPRSLKSELHVRSRVIEDEEVLQQRQELVATKSPAELSQIHSLGEIPIPSRIEAWLHGTETEDRSTVGEGGEAEPTKFPRSKKELNDAFYQTFPSMDTHCIVRSKVEDPDVLINRQQLSQNRSIHELSKIRNLSEFPIPGDLFRLPDIPLPSIKMKSILKLIARSPSQNKKAPAESETYHSYQMPQGPNSDSDVMSTPMTEDGMFHSIASRDQDSPTSSITKDREFGYEVISRPREGPADFHEDILETLPTPPPPPAPECPSPRPDSALPAPPTPELEHPQDGFGLAGLTKGTPERNVRSKSKKKNRRSQDVADDGVMSISSTVTDDIPPALPPKRGSPQKGMSLESQPSLDDDIELEAIPVKKSPQMEKEFSPPIPTRRGKSHSKSVEPREMTDQATPIEERIQSRPLPAPPAPPRTLKKQSSGSVEPEDGRLSRTSTRSGRSAARDDLTYADTENFKSVAETMASSRTMAVTEQFHTVQDTLESHTLLVTGNKTRNSEDDLTLADSVVDSLQSCCETLIVDNDHENLDTCADTLTAAELDDQFYDDDDNPYPSVDFNSMMLGPGGHIVEPESPSVVRDKS